MEELLISQLVMIFGFFLMIISIVLKGQTMSKKITNITFYYMLVGTLIIIISLLYNNLFNYLIYILIYIILFFTLISAFFLSDISSSPKIKFISQIIFVFTLITIVIISYILYFK